MTDQDFRITLIEANKAFSNTMIIRPGVYKELDRTTYILGYLCQQYNCTDILNKF